MIIQSSFKKQPTPEKHVPEHSNKKELPGNHYDGFLSYCSWSIYNSSVIPYLKPSSSDFLNRDSIGLLKDSLKDNEFIVSDIEIFFKGDIRAAGFRMDNYLFIVFEGTNSLVDIILDLKFLFRTGNPSRHRGFQQGWDLLSYEIICWIRKQKMNEGIILCGHSLGGSLAIIGGEHLSRIFRVARVVTFGAPRVGGGRYKTYYNDLMRLRDITLQYQLPDDGIPNVPPKPMYTHVGLIQPISLYNLINKAGNSECLPVNRMSSYTAMVDDNVDLIKNFLLVIFQRFSTLARTFILLLPFYHRTIAKAVTTTMTHPSRKYLNYFLVEKKEEGSPID